jgi:hypothetical protein
MSQEVRTLYVQVDYTDHLGTDHVRGDSVQYQKSDREGSELVRRGVLSMKPVRRQAGEGGRRNTTGDTE